MSRRASRLPRHRAHAHTEGSARAAVWPILKRIPVYMRLAWALAREPSIPRRYKALLYSSAAYSFTPVSMVTGAVPVLGQLDGILLLLLGIRQAAEHCPPDACRRHYARLNLAPDQINQDLAAISSVTRGVGRQVGTEARFVGRVAGGFGRRLLRRLLTEIGDSD